MKFLCTAIVIFFASSSSVNARSFRKGDAVDPDVVAYAAAHVTATTTTTTTHRLLASTTTFLGVDGDTSSCAPESWTSSPEIGATIAGNAVGGFINAAAGEARDRIADKLKDAGLKMAKTKAGKIGTSMMKALSSSVGGLALGIVADFFLPDPNEQRFEELTTAVGCLDGKVDALQNQVTELAAGLARVSAGLAREVFRSNGVDMLLTQDVIGHLYDDLKLIEADFRSDINLGILCNTPSGPGKAITDLSGTNLPLASAGSNGITTFMCTCETLMRDYNPISSEWRDSMARLDVFTDRLKKLVFMLSRPEMVGSQFFMANKAQLWGATRALVAQYADVALKAGVAYAGLRTWAHTPRLKSEQAWWASSCSSRAYDPLVAIPATGPGADDCASACKPDKVLASMRADLQTHVVEAVEGLVVALRGTAASGWRTRTASSETTDRIVGPQVRTTPVQGSLVASRWVHSSTSPGTTIQCLGFSNAARGKTFTRCGHNGNALTRAQIKTLMYLKPPQNTLVGPELDQFQLPEPLPADKDLVTFAGVDCTLSGDTGLWWSEPTTPNSFLPKQCRFNELYDPLYTEIKQVLPAVKLQVKTFLSPDEASIPAADVAEAQRLGALLNPFRPQQSAAAIVVSQRPGEMQTKRRAADTPALCNAARAVAFGADSQSGGCTGNGHQLVGYCGGPSQAGAFASASVELTDGSAEASDYGSFMDCEYRVSAPSGGKLKVEFPRFQTENNYDFVWIYDGPECTGTATKQLTGTPSISDRAMVSTGSSVCIKFYSDYSVHKKGWAVTITKE